MIFGTDGIRGAFGSEPLTAKTIKRLSAVLRDWLPRPGKVVIGRDPRQSSETLQSWITSGLGDARILDLGVAPTPVVAYETRARGGDLGIMITASHNPASDNGLKFFDRHGLKVQAEQARNWSDAILAKGNPHEETRGMLKQVEAENYRRFILRHFQRGDFSGLKLAFDLSHGAGAPFLKPLIAELGIDARFMGDSPNGRNINEGVGATQPKALAGFVRENGLQAGFALDGDGDRLTLTTSHVIHGDIALYALYRCLQTEGVEVKAIVSTILCGLGLEHQLDREGIPLYRTPVGDQHVLAELVSRDLILGGEPSGHLIQSHLFPAGDGFLAALSIAKGLAHNPSLIQLSEAAVPMYPIYESAVQIQRKPPLEEIEPLCEKQESIRRKIGEPGRLIVRYSGTEPKVRLFVETPKLAELRDDIQALEQIIAKELA